jgi:hypothetical protein
MHKKLKNYMKMKYEPSSLVAQSATHFVAIFHWIANFPLDCLSEIMVISEIRDF